MVAIAGKTQVPVWGPAAIEAHNQEIQLRQIRHAGQRQHWIDSNRYYYRSVYALLRHCIERGKTVLNLRSQTGGLLAALEPSRGVGVEISAEMVEIARTRHPEFEYIQSFPEELDPEDPKLAGEKFDYVLFSDIGETADFRKALSAIRSAMGRHSRLILSGYNPLWEPLVRFAEKLGWKVPQHDQCWLDKGDLYGLLHLSGYEPLRTFRTVLCPKYIPLVSFLLNRILAKIPPLNELCLVQVVVARLAPEPAPLPSVSVIIPCKDEAGNVEFAVERMPALGSSTEIIFCDDKSTDGTADKVRDMQRRYPEKNIRLLAGPGICKSKNVWTGFRGATGDILMILDADLTVMPEELPHFYDAIASGRAEFVNGSRLVYPVPRAAMKITNMIGNHLFGLLFSNLLGQRVKDTLCGTKVLWRSDWKRIEPMLDTWGITDRWGDYELLFGASRLNLRIIDQPVHYQERIYGVTKMTKVFKNGLIMLRMCLRGFVRLRLSY